MTNTNLKIIAIISMLIDHVGAVLFPEVLALRIIGRLAFPIFCFLIVEGYFHTKDLKKYITRLGIFAIIAEVPFDLAFHDTILEFTYQNVFFTLAIGLVAVYLYDKRATSSLHLGLGMVATLGILMIKKAYESPIESSLLIYVVVASALILVLSYIFKDKRHRALDILGVTLCAVFATVIMSDYFFLGIMFIFFMYLFRDDFKRKFIFIFVLSVTFFLIPFISSGEFVLSQYTQSFQVLGLIPIYFYNGKKGASMKYVFYAFYPVHLLIITWIDKLQLIQG